MKRFFLLTVLTLTVLGVVSSQDIKNNANSNHANKFEQLGTILPTPNEQRTASGAPGGKYWQMRADYDIKCELVEANNKLTGSETITYYNNSPDVLNYLWMQLDENQHSTVNNANYQNQNPMPGNNQSTDKVLDRYEEGRADNGYGFNITKLTDLTGKALKHTINKTMMKVDLPVALKPGQKFVFKIDWNYKIVNRSEFLRFGGGRGGYEKFEDGNTNYIMPQFYPRMCKYGDEVGWQNHQFTGSGEFTLSFGNFKVQITVPADHIVSATGECQNYASVLSPAQIDRWQKAQNTDQPLQIVTMDEAMNTAKQKSLKKKTWIFKADNVRDFAWTSSRRFAWDAMPVKVQGKKIMCMSVYDEASAPIYSKFSTKAVAHTIKTYSNFSIPYPYPVAISAGVYARGGMEYPMISFNPGRAEKDGSYTEGAKNSAILVIIHEVGHTFFPMIINSDERQWTWMDEGLNSYLQYLTQELWDNKFPSRGGPAWSITDYMKLPKDQLEPIMTNSENIIDFGSNAYDKVATGLNILRETIVGRELFDNAFREYSKRWAFKHPTPADFFRTIEDATGEDLDWFWRGWFFGTDACDIAIDTIKHAKPDLTAIPSQTKDTIVYRPLPKAQTVKDDISKMRNREDQNIKFETDRDTTIRDFYWRYARDMEKYDTTKYPVLQRAGTEALDEEGRLKYANKNFYEITFSNKGGLVMPIIIEWTYKDGTKEVERIPAQVWRKNETKVIKSFMKDKEVASVKLDPYNETADINTDNNTYSNIKEPSKFKLFKQKQFLAPPPGINPMQKAQEKKAF